MKVLLCAIVKNENKYINEWLEHYKQLGFSKVILYDNNDINGEQIKHNFGKFVQVIDYRGKHISVNISVSLKNHGIQEQAYNDCYLNYASNYDWVAFFDIDEFLIIDNNLTINEFLSQDKFNNIDAIQFNWQIYGDNNQIEYSSKPVKERFTTLSLKQTQHVKTIVRTNNQKFIAIPCHYAYLKTGNFSYPNGNRTKMGYKQPINYEGAHINHYYTKSIEEWIDRKYNATSATGKDYLNNNINRRISEFFQHNTWTSDKDVFIKNKINQIKEKSKNNYLKIALCAIAKEENLYIREWVKWYFDLGINKIFLYDNNDIDGERFDDIISDYIRNGFVEIIDKRGIVKSVSTDKDGMTTQGQAFYDCFYKHKNEYDWMCFFDIDEFLEIYHTYNDIFDFLNDFSSYDSIRVQWKMYGDNNQLFYNNKPLFERFRYINNSKNDKHVKQIINCNKEFKEELIFCAHGYLNKSYNNVNVLKETQNNPYMEVTGAKDNLPVYLNHFYSKSTEEFIRRKYKKTSAVTGINNNRNFNLDFLKNQYFENNTYADDKEKFIDLFVNSENTVNVYMASLFQDGHVIQSIKSIICQPQVKSLTLSANNYTDDEYDILINEIKSDKLIIHRTNNEKMSFEKLRYVLEDKDTKYVAFCDDDLIYRNGYFIKMIYECEHLDSVVSYHGGILKTLPISHYYIDRKSFSFNREVKENKQVDIIGNGVSLFKREWLTDRQWKSLYKNAPEISMDDITISYALRKNGKSLYVIEHCQGDVIERRNNDKMNTVYNTYKKDDSIQTEWVNTHFIKLK